MQKNFINIILTIISIFILSGCGGEDAAVTGSSTPTTSTYSGSTPKSFTTPPSETAARIIEAVETIEEEDFSGIIVDAGPVEGLRVVCGSLEIITDSKGFFECEEFPMSVYLGEYKLGTVAKLPLSKIVFTQDILGVALGATTHSEVTKVSMILQSLDNNASPTEGISLTQDTLDTLNTYLSTDEPLEDISQRSLGRIIKNTIKDMQEYDENSQLTAVSKEEAQNNLTTMTSQAPTLTYEQRISRGVN